tara:strand:- start:13 stop:741 length:729 start_codon:yes stop_codon:yes gene_type:complete
MPSIEVAIEEFAVGPGDIILVHHGLYEVNATQIPAGVHLRAVEGPAATTLALSEGATAGIILGAGAVMEGFSIGPSEDSVISDITIFVDMLPGSDGTNASNRLEFNIIGGLPDSSATNARAVRVRGPGSEVFHNTFIYSLAGVSFDQGVTLIDTAVANNVFNDVAWPVTYNAETDSCVQQTCVGTGATECNSDAECSVIMAPLNNHVYCSNDDIYCTGEDPLFTSDYIPSTAPGSVSPLIGA